MDFSKRISNASAAPFVGKNKESVCKEKGGLEPLFLDKNRFRVYNKKSSTLYNQDG